MRAVKIILTCSIVVAAWIGGYGYGRWYGLGRANIPGTHKQPKGYHCPMHPNFRSDKPGECGICGMRLVPDYDLTPEQIHNQQMAQSQRGKILYYRDPQFPNYKSDKAGINPESGNDLVPVYENEPGSMPMGTIQVSAEKQQLIGVQYGVAELASGTRTFRANGRVMPDETRIAKVQTKIEGWIDKVFVDFTGKLVTQGQALLTLYSPEMLATQQEYLLALKSRDLWKSGPLESSRDQGESLVAAARRRLELWDLSEGQIKEIESTGKPLRNITLYSPITGYVTDRKAFPKQRIAPDTELYTVVDLSHVWIMADVFESDVAMIREGMPVRVTMPYLQGAPLAARVNYIQPQVDPMTRTLKVRLEAPNPHLRLKLDMFVDVQFQVAMPVRVTVPTEAVLDAGMRKTVFVDRGNGYLEPRNVETGERWSGRVEILQGLGAGERVVISGNFLIDSESQLKSAAAGMAGHQHGGMTGGDTKQTTPAAADPHSGHTGESKK